MADNQCGSNRVNGAEKRSAFEAEFPSPRYFQVHFEYLDSLLLDAAKSLGVLRAEVAEVYRVMQTGQVSDSSGMDGVDRGDEPALRIEPCTNRRRPKRSARQRNVDCGAG
ncbi:MAG: hypothetical protein ACRERU_03300 [Methylococcales bacterium]